MKFTIMMAFAAATMLAGAATAQPMHRDSHWNHHRHGHQVCHWRHHHKVCHWVR